MQWYLFSAVFLLCAAYTLCGRACEDRHPLWPAAAPLQISIDIFGTVFFLLPLCAVTIHLVWPVVMDKIASHETSANSGGLLLWPVWVLIPAGFLLLALQGCPRSSSASPSSMRRARPGGPARPKRRSEPEEPR